LLPRRICPPSPTPPTTPSPTAHHWEAKDTTSTTVTPTIKWVGLLTTTSSSVDLKVVVVVSHRHQHKM